MSKQPPPAPTASAIGPCPTIIQIVGRPGTGSLPSTIAGQDEHGLPKLNIYKKKIKHENDSSRKKTLNKFGPVFCQNDP